MRALRRLPAVTVAWLALAAAAFAQTAAPHEWSRGTTLNGFAGIATESSSSGPAFGGALGWELTPRFALEGSGSWIEFDGRHNAFAAAMKVRGRLFGRRKIDPFLQGGIGLYRASFDARTDEMPGPMMNGTFIGAMPSLASYRFGDVPHFYQHRMDDFAGDDMLRRTFTDPAFVFGGGVNLFVTRHLAIRPDVEAMVVVRDRRSQMVTSIGVHAVYHFEEHPVTPALRRMVR